jgi:N-acetylmuramoyl-L-alanine amidase
MEDGPRLERGHSGPEVLELQAMLARYGYGLAATGVYDEGTTSAVTAFQRHYRQFLVDGVADRSTITTLRRLIDALASG